MDSKYSIGKRGEQLAESFLLAKGYEVLKKNYRKKTGELDIVSLYKGTIYFIEVKNWSHFEIIHPLEVFTKKKIAKMRKMASYFFYERNWKEERYTVSFSLLNVVGEKIDFYTDLF
jgi:putative endonuclease